MLYRKFELNKDNSGNLLIKLKNVDENEYKHIYIKSALIIRNYIDYSCFYAESSNYIIFIIFIIIIYRFVIFTKFLITLLIEIDFKCITKDNCLYKWDKYLDNNDLYLKREISKRSLIENNKTVIGAYINTYIYNKGLCL